MIPSFPAELFRPIIQHVTQNADLYSVALSSRLLREEAQCGLFIYPALGRTFVQHLLFLDVIISSPQHLALLVRSYTQVDIGSGEWQSENTSMSTFLKKRTNNALRSMSNLKHLKYKPWDRLPSAVILEGCSFQLHSFSWSAECDGEPLLTMFLPKQHSLRHIELYTSFLTGSPEWKHIARTICPNLQSVSGPRATVDLFLPGRSIKCLQWNPIYYRDDVWPDVDPLANDLSQVEYLMYGNIKTLPSFSSIAHHMHSLVLLDVVHTDHDDYTEILPLMPNLGIVIFTLTGRWPHPTLADADSVASDPIRLLPSLKYIDVEYNRYKGDQVRYFMATDGNICSMAIPREKFRSWRTDIAAALGIELDPFKT